MIKTTRRNNWIIKSWKGIEYAKFKQISNKREIWLAEKNWKILFLQLYQEQ